MYRTAYMAISTIFFWILISIYCLIFLKCYRSSQTFVVRLGKYPFCSSGMRLLIFGCPCILLRCEQREIIVAFVVGRNKNRNKYKNNQVYQKVQNFLKKKINTTLFCPLPLSQPLNLWEKGREILSFDLKSLWPSRYNFWSQCSLIQFFISKCEDPTFKHHCLVHWVFTSNVLVDSDLFMLSCRISSVKHAVKKASVKL